MGSETEFWSQSAHCPEISAVKHRSEAEAVWRCSSKHLVVTQTMQLLTTPGAKYDWLLVMEPMVWIFLPNFTLNSRQSLGCLELVQLLLKNCQEQEIRFSFFLHLMNMFNWKSLVMESRLLLRVCPVFVVPSTLGNSNLFHQNLNLKTTVQVTDPPSPSGFWCLDTATDSSPPDIWTQNSFEGETPACHTF